MELLVDISEKDYLNFVLQNDNGILEKTVPSHRAKIAIANGIPLPKGHGRLIDAEALDDNCDWYHTDDDGSWCYKCADIDNVPTIIEADKEGAEE